MDKTIYKNISVSKLSDQAEVNTKRTTHSVNISDSSFQNKKTAGDLWTKEGQYGKFLSGVLKENKEYKDKEGNLKLQKGYSIISDEYLKELIDNQGGEINIQSDEIAF